MIDISSRKDELLRKIQDAFAVRGVSELRLKIEKGEVKVFAVRVNEIK